MSIKQVKDELRRFFKAKDNLALCLSGKWGVGKTYTWNTLLEEAFDNNTVNPKQYAYVSLFGLESLADVRRSLFENTKGAAAFKSVEPLEVTVNNISNCLSHLVSKWRAAAGFIRGIPIVANYSDLAEKVGFLSVRNQIVCFDDLERRSDSLALKDMLGLISFLKEERNCKVILLLNEEALKDNDKEDFKVQLEKIIDINLVFAPTSEEAVSIAIPDRSIPRFQLVADYTTKLGISNIRTIFKLLRIAQRFEEILTGYDERILEQAIHSVCLYGFALYQPKDAPPIKIIEEPENHYEYMLKDAKEKTPEEIQWSEFLIKYEYQNIDSFDLVVFESIRSGFYDEASIKFEADNLVQKCALEDQEKAFRKAWDIYHNSFNDDAGELAKELKRSIVDNAAAICPDRLTGAIIMLKRIGYGDDIEEILAGYINSRDEDKEFWDNYSPTFDAPDPDVARAFSVKATQFEDEWKLPDVVKGIVRDGGWKRGTLEFIDKHSVDEFYRMLKDEKGGKEELRWLIYGLLYFRQMADPDKTMQNITTKAISALQKIGQESLINRCRVEKFGIEVPDA